MMAAPRAPRIIFWGRLRMPWRLPAWPIMTLPEPERRKRFLAPDLFFSLGIFASFQNETRHLERLGMPFRRTAHSRTRGYSRPAGGLPDRPRTGGEADTRPNSATNPADAGFVAPAPPGSCRR